MDTLTMNFFWMVYNGCLAIIAIVCGWLLYKSKRKSLQFLFGILWFIFIPNTIYIITDSIHFPEQYFSIRGDFKFILFVQYLLFVTSGIVSFILALHPIERFLLRRKPKIDRNTVTLFIILLNFTISLGVMMGRFQRTNSWEVFTNPIRVYKDAVMVIGSTNRLLWVISFGVFCNLLFFSIRKLFILKIR